MRRLAPAAIFGLVLLTYAASLAGTFAGDDFILVRNARNASWSFADLARAFQWDEETITDGWLPPDFQDFRLHYFRPVVMASLKLDLALWGERAAGFYFTNIALYLLITLLVYRWGADFGLGARGRFLLGILFAAWSVNQLAVNQINGRTELVAGVFVLASVISLGQFHRGGGSAAYSLALGAAVLALGSKENAVMLPLFHTLAAAFLYPPEPIGRDGWRRRVWVVAPFYALIPAYFAVRSVYLDGFPVPPGGFYFHDPGEPGFLVFFLAKLAHAPLALFYQVPALVYPAIIERSPALLAVALVAAAATAFVVLRWMRPPFRYFFIGWLVICLAPTATMGHNPIYYLLCAPVVVVLYVKLHEAGCNSSVRWRARAARAMIPASIVFGVLVSTGNAIAVRASGVLPRAAAERVAAYLDAHPEVEEVFLIDVPWTCGYLVPAIRFAAERHADKAFTVLSVTADIAGEVPSRITAADAHTIELRPASGAYLRTGLEPIFMARPLPRFRAGMSARDPAYTIEISEVEEAYIREEGPLLQAIREGLDAPPETQRGVLALRYRFTEPLEAPGRAFLQLAPSGEVKLFRPEY